MTLKNIAKNPESFFNLGHSKKKKKLLEKQQKKKTCVINEGINKLLSNSSS